MEGREMTETTTELWAVHVEGPDDILPAESREAAQEKADAINAAYGWYATKPGAHEDDRWHAEVVPWTGPAERHARHLATLTGEEYMA
jgi:hypothetical protein